ncbi:MAG TPA: hypothetical protein VJQ45_06015 [Ktedonobacterales bacterium]|nr:hypothetical protein [Ktedonobacterales bacterium]
MADDRNHSTARGEDEQGQTSARPGEQQGQGQGQSNPFLRKIQQVERQGVPEEGAVNPGPPPGPVRSGEFHIGPIAPESQGKER